MLALTVRQPWAWAVLHCGKTVENRRWQPTALQLVDRFLIHAGRGVEHVDLGQPSQLPRGVAYCLVTLAGVHHADDPGCHCPPAWAEPGGWHWLLADPQAVEQVPLLGRLGLWPVPQEISELLVQGEGACDHARHSAAADTEVVPHRGD